MGGAQPPPLLLQTYINLKIALVMHTRFFQVLQLLSELCEELNVMTAIEDCESTATFFGTKGDYTLKGKWLCCSLPIEDAARIAKDSISMILPYELDDQWALLCVRFDGQATIIKHIED